MRMASKNVSLLSFHPVPKSLIDCYRGQSESVSGGKMFMFISNSGSGVVAVILNRVTSF